MVKVSYCCMSNMSSIISSHNKRLLRPRTIKYGCNCWMRENCPLQNQCLTLNLIYWADVENNSYKVTKIKFGLSKTSFKMWFANHNKDFNHEQWSTELSKHIWLLKEDQITSRIRWSFAEKVYVRTKINFCPLCLTKKLHLIEHSNDHWLLNKRTKLISEGRHQVKLLLKSFKWK